MKHGLNRSSALTGEVTARRDGPRCDDQGYVHTSCSVGGSRLWNAQNPSHPIYR